MNVGGERGAPPPAGVQRLGRFRRGRRAAADGPLDARVEETVHPAEGPVRSRPASATWAIWVLVVSAFLLALGYWTYFAVETSLRGLREAALTSMLEAEAKALALWVENRKTDIQRLARDPSVRDQIVALSRIAARPGVASADYCYAPARRPFVAQVASILEEQGAVTFNAVDRGRRIIASRFAEYCGLNLSEQAFERDLAPVFRGETRFVRPYRLHERLELAPPSLPLERPVTWVETPVRDASGAIIAALAFGEYADGQFAEILSAGRIGATGEAYAFDRAGTLLSPGRFGTGTTPIALQAASAARGAVLDPYPSYHGHAVIGAWRWLPEYDLGIAVELGAEEAYAPLRYLNIAFGVVFGALVIAVFAALVSVLSVVRLRRELGDGRKIGPYRLRERIGEGGAAAIYLAQHDLLKRPTAVKLLKPARMTDVMIARFEREVQLASSLSHPNTIEIFDYGRTRDGLLYYAMEYLDGLTLSDVVARDGALPVSRCLHILRQVCAALAEAHSKGIIHRDISPDNIMVCRYGGQYDFVKILDYGLVKQVTAHSNTRDLTRGLRIVGTLLYMAPERLRDAADVDARADIYAVGAVAFLMLTGRKLFEATDDVELTTKILSEEPPRVSEAAQQPIPVDLDLIVTSCVEKKRELRPRHVADLGEAFDSLALEHRWTQADAERWWSNLPKAA
jgi:eukaryotic-like serine/threonine-protein kinase